MRIWGDLCKVQKVYWKLMKLGSSGEVLMLNGAERGGPRRVWDAEEVRKGCWGWSVLHGDRASLQLELLIWPTCKMWHIGLSGSSLFWCSQVNWDHHMLLETGIGNIIVNSFPDYKWEDWHHSVAQEGELLLSHLFSAAFLISRNLQPRHCQDPFHMFSAFSA